MVSQAKGGCKECGSMAHTKMYHNRKPIGRVPRVHKSPQGKFEWQKSDKNPSKDPLRREQIRLEKTGVIQSAETRAKKSESMKRALSNPEIREKWRAVKIGQVPSMETRKKISASHAKRPKTTAQLKVKLDKIFSLYIRLRDTEEVDGIRVGVCITCDSPVGIGSLKAGQAGHFMSRRFSSTRFDEQNVNIQCARCNMWGAGEQYLYSIALDKKYGEGTALRLHEKSKEYHKFTSVKLQEMIDYYKDIVSKY